MLFHNPRVLPALLVVIGVTMLYLRGQQLQDIQQWNPQDIETAVELNYALDLMRGGQETEPSEAEKQARLSDIRQEIVSTFVEPQQRIEREYEQAKWMTGIGLVLMLVVLILQQHGILKK